MSVILLLVPFAGLAILFIGLKISRWLLPLRKVA